MKILLHACCAPCSAPILENFLKNRVKPSVFYFNPNIYPREEYEKRKCELKKYTSKIGVEMLEGDYDHKAWLSEIKGLENEPERGSRCLKCFKMRLKKTAEIAVKNGFDTFASSLSSSRWKSLEQIDEAGFYSQDLQDNKVCYMPKNWRKGGLQQRRNEIIKEENFYNQLYCGCEFSFR